MVLLHSAVRVSGLVVALPLWLCVFLDSGFRPLADACCGPFLQPEVAGVQCDNLVVELFEAGTIRGAEDRASANVATAAATAQCQFDQHMYVKASNERTR